MSPLASASPFNKAFRHLNFVRSGKRGEIESHWSPRLPHEKYLDAACVLRNGGTLDRDTSDYFVGREIGIQAARNYLNYRAEHGFDSRSSWLQFIVRDMIPGGRDVDGMLQGEIAGFLSAIDTALEGKRP